MEKELTVRGNYDVGKVTDMSKMANVLKKHIVDNKLYTQIVGKNYVHVEGWTYAGGLMGMYPKVAAVENLSSGTEFKWKANVEIIRIADDKVVGFGYALCSNKENKKKTFDEYAVLSMAQTRAIGKAYRNLIGWVMKLAGYEGTPSEEMVKMGETGPEAAIATLKAKSNPTGSIKGITCAGDCGTVVENEAVIKFSKQRYGKVLCRGCQGKKRK